MTSPSIEILLNGKPHALAEGQSVADLVIHLGLDRAPVAVERNQSLVTRDQRNTVRLEAGDRVEIVTLVGGG